MANTQTPKQAVDLESLSDESKQLYRDYSEDLKAHDDAIVHFDAFEAMHNSQTYDAVSKETGNGLTDSMTATIYLERAARVAGQLPAGEVVAIGKKDYGKGLFVDILREKWIYPNANAQRPFKTKMYMWQYGSSEYGYMPMYYDLSVSPSGYFGPDCWLWNPRNFIPQAGFTTISDMDYVHALAEKSPQFFEDILSDDTDKTWKKDAINSVIDQIRNFKKETDTNRDTLKTRTERNQSVKKIVIATRYEAGPDGRWVSFLPDFSFKVIRSIKNPHKNNRIPFVIKACIPTFDSFYNIGDFQRSMPMQFANDGLDNFYFQGIKINLFPPTVINAQAFVRQTVRNEAASIWETTGPVNGNVEKLQPSPAGLSTYSSAKGMAHGAIQSIAGTTDTRANSDNSMDPAFGKTPEALKMIGQREDTRDAQDRENLEEAMRELIDGMLSLLPLIPTKIPIDLFSEEIEDIIKSGYQDLAEIFVGARSSGLAKWRMSESGNQMRLRIDPKALQGMEYHFRLQPGSTAKQTKSEQIQSMMDFFGFVGKIPNALQDYKEATGRIPNWDNIFNQFGRLADLPGFDNMFMKAPQQGQPQVVYVDPSTGKPVPVDPTTGKPVGVKGPIENMSLKDVAAVSTEAAGAMLDQAKLPHNDMGGQPPAQPPAQPGTPPAAQPGQPDLSTVSPQNPVIIHGHKFTDPKLAEEAIMMSNFIRSRYATANADQQPSGRPVAPATAGTPTA